MKTIKATTEPAPPVVKFVANTWHRAHRDNVHTIFLRLQNGELLISLDATTFNPPPAELFGPMVREFLSYSGVRVWPWTQSVRGKKCRVEAGDSTGVWAISSTNLKQELTISRS